jgi:hypothetical protein
MLGQFIGRNSNNKLVVINIGYFIQRQAAKPPIIPKTIVFVNLAILVELINVNYFHLLTTLTQVLSHCRTDTNKDSSID